MADNEANEAVGKSPTEAMRNRIAALAQHPVGTGKGRHVDAGLDMVVVDVAIEDDQVEGVNGRHITVTVKAFNAGERIVAWLGRLEGHDTPDPYHALRLEVSNYDNGTAAVSTSLLHGFNGAASGAHDTHTVSIDSHDNVDVLVPTGPQGELLRNATPAQIPDELAAAERVLAMVEQAVDSPTKFAAFFASQTD